ncbi:MAG: glycosyltransferase [Sedimentisphaerales bacterium]|nr:glycosyltransferase [Sedimentisphaerales bacterium]MBN2844070.1 glycosyltransferase [Sedimentisphaerales bacterium]
MSDKYKILHCAGSLSYQIGGPAHSVPGLCRGLLGLGHEVALCRMGNDDEISDINGLDSDYVPLSDLPYIGHDLAVGFKELLLKREFDLIHTHAIWHRVGAIADEVARKADKPHIITLRGMLTQWAMNHKRWKKLTGWYLYQKKIMQRAACIHCTSVSEMEDYRRLGMRNPVAIIANGIDLPQELPKDSDLWIIDKWPQLKGKRILLFFSRINPKKGLDMLAMVWGEVARLNPDWHLIIAGPDEAGYQGKIEAMFRVNGSIDSVLFSGPLYGLDKSRIYTASDLFILPTYSENFGIAIGEALSYGKPVITTTGAPWQDVLTYDCGWQVAPEPQYVKDALSDALSKTSQQLRLRGGHGKKLICDKYSWNKIAIEMTEVYKWIINGGIKPDCVYE